MKRTLALTSTVLLLITSCIPSATPARPTPLPPVTPLPTITLSPTSTPLPTETLTLTATPRPQATLVRETSLYEGPDNDEKVVARLRAGTVVFPLATFGDFVEAEVAADTGIQTGFIGKITLDSIPVALPVLDMNEVPWQSVDILSRFALNPEAEYLPTIRDNTLVEDITTKAYSSFLDFPFVMESAFRLTFQMETAEKGLGSISFKNKRNNTDATSSAVINCLGLQTNHGILSIGITDTRSHIEFQLAADGQTVSDSQTLSITFLDPFGKVFVINDQDNREILMMDVTQLDGVKLPDGLFPERKVRIGYGVVAHESIKLASLSLQLAPSGIWNDAADLAFQPTIRQLAEQRGITFGTDFSWWTYMTDPFTNWWNDTTDPDIWKIFPDTYDSVTLSKWRSTSFWSGIGEYDFRELDALVNWAIRNNFRVRVSPLISGRYDSLPNWLKNGSYTRDQYMQILEEDIKTVVGHFKGRVAEWSITVADQSPPRSRSYTPRGDFWENKIGPDYLGLAFRWAREADPDAVLIYNADNNECPTNPDTQKRIDDMISSIKSMKAQGVPIDAVGMQMHLLLPWNGTVVPQKACVIQTMRQFADLGVMIYITEFDVDLEDITGPQEKRWNFEAQVYRDMVEACLESGVCKSFSTWGISDSTSWETCPQWWCLNLPIADPLMFDKNLQPKPAYYAVRDALAGISSSTPTPSP